MKAKFWVKVSSAMLVVLTSLIIAGCGGQSSSTGQTTTGSGTSATNAASAGSSGSSADVAYATAEVNKYAGVPSFTPPAGATPFDASKLRGKTVFFVGVGTEFQLQKVMIPVFQSALSRYGVKMTVFQNQGTPSEWATGVEQGVSQKYNAILLNGNNPEYFAPAVKLANQAGIPVIPSWDRTPNEAPARGVKLFGDSFASDQLQGKLQADWVIANADGKPVNALLINSSDQLEGAGQIAVMKSEFAKYCPTCKITEINVPGSEWAQKLQSATQSALVANPNINYVLPLYTAEAEYVVPAIEAVGGQNRIKAVAANGTPFGLDYIRTGNIYSADVGMDLQCMGDMAADNVMRALAGLKPVENVDPQTGWGSIPVRLWTKANVVDAGVPASYLKGYGSACADYYARIWAGK